MTEELVSVKTKTLSDLLHDAENLMSEIINSGGEIDLNIEALIAQNRSQLAEKMDAYGYVLAGLKRRQEYAVERMKEWSSVASLCDKSLENLERKIVDALGRLEVDSIHGKEFTFKTQLNPVSVVIKDEAQIPGDFIITETKTTTKVDKKAIADQFKRTNEVPAGVEITRSTRLVTKASDFRGNN